MISSQKSGIRLTKIVKAVIRQRGPQRTLWTNSAAKLATGVSRAKNPMICMNHARLQATISLHERANECIIPDR